MRVGGSVAGFVILSWYAVVFVRASGGLLTDALATLDVCAKGQRFSMSP